MKAVGICDRLGYPPNDPEGLVGRVSDGRGVLAEVEAVESVLLSERLKEMLVLVHVVDLGLKSVERRL